MRHLERQEGVGLTDAAKVIMVSANDDSRTVYRAFFQGQAMSFLPKPFTGDAVLDELRKFDIIDDQSAQRNSA
jgi:two-component system chemotaxis response regulator CheY